MIQFLGKNHRDITGLHRKKIIRLQDKWEGHIHLN